MPVTFYRYCFDSSLGYAGAYVSLSHEALNRNCHFFPSLPMFVPLLLVISMLLQLRCGEWLDAEVKIAMTVLRTLNEDYGGVYVALCNVQSFFNETLLMAAIHFRSTLNNARC